MYFLFFQLFLNISVRTYSLHVKPPYEDTLASPTILRLMYTTSRFNPTFTGYSYTTQDLNGDGSNVVFATDTDSVSRLKNEMNSIYKVNDMNMPDRPLQRDTSNKMLKQTLMSSELTSKQIETNMTKQQNFESNVKIFNEEKPLPRNSEINNNFAEYQVSPQQVSFIYVPYSAFRSNLLNLQLPTVHAQYSIPSNNIENQYYSHNFYTHSELSPQNFDFYNPTIPIFYQAAITSPDSSFEPTPTISKDIKISTETSITKDSQTVTESNSSKSNTIEPRVNSEATTNIAEAILSSESPLTDKLESITTSERTKEKIINNESTNSIETPEISVEQVIENKANSTELANTEAIPLMKKSSVRKM